MSLGARSFGVPQDDMAWGLCAPRSPSLSEAVGARVRGSHARLVYNRDPGIRWRFANVTKSLNDWLQEGESLYDAALAEYQQLEAQLDELEARLAAKRAEVNQIAQVVGKPAIENNRRLTADRKSGV